MADKGYAVHSFRGALWDMDSRPAVPTESDEQPVRCPARIYNDRHQIENVCARPKEWWAVATRHGRTVASIMGVLCLAAAIHRIKP